MAVAAKKKSNAISKAQFNKLKQELEMSKKSASWSRLFEIAQEWRLFGEHVTRPYEQVSSVYKAVKAIADNVPQADLRFRDWKSKKEIEDDEIINLFENPNPFMTESDFIQAWVGFVSLYGEAMIIKETSIGQMTGSRKLPAELWAFNPTDFEEVRQGRLIVGWRYQKEQILFKPEEVIFIKDFNPYSLFRGMSPLKPIDKIIDIDWQTLVFNKAFFDNDGTPGLILSTEDELSKEVIDRIRLQWKQRHQGASNAFKVAVLEGGLKPVDHLPTHKEMDFIEQKRLTREEILGIWRAPKALFNITEDLNYATFVGQMKIFWNYAIMPVMRKIESAINKYIVWPYNEKIEAFFDYSNVIAYQEDFKDKTETASKLFAIGFTRNEINSRLNLGFEEVPWGDVWWASFGLTPVSGAENNSQLINDEGNKSKIALNPRKAAIWKGFLAKQNNIETRMAGGISKYFLEQRKVILRELNEKGPEGLKVDWDEQDKKLKDKAYKYIYLAIKEGIDFGRTILGRKSLSDEEFEAKIQSFLVTRTDKITMINQTLKKQIKINLEEGLKLGETVQQLADRIRTIYNMASARSLMIARTETVGAVNGGSQLYYESEGVKEKEWLTAGDENVRESHQRLDGEVKLVGQSFSNGLEYPGDQKGQPEDVINCRCTILPVAK